MAVLFQAESEGLEGSEDLDEDFLTTRIREVSVEGSKDVLEKTREEGFELSLEGFGGDSDEFDDVRLKGGVVPVFEDHGEDGVEEVSDVLLDKGDEGSEFGEPGSLVGRTVVSDGGEHGRNDLRK